MLVSQRRSKKQRGSLWVGLVSWQRWYKNEKQREGREAIELKPNKNLINQVDPQMPEINQKRNSRSSVNIFPILNQQLPARVGRESMSCLVRRAYLARLPSLPRSLAPP